MPTLEFKGKTTIWNHHMAVPYHTLEHVPELDFQPEKGEDNLIIEGDNLTALKSLLPEYAGKIDCIYIDPPYNTGNEGWVYNDNVNHPLLKDWLGKEVGSDDLTKHDKWLCMMTPRLKLLRELLSESGVIFISIDDVEVHRLRKLVEEVWGEHNLVAMIPVITNLKGNQDAFAFADTHEYVFCIAKDKTSFSPGSFRVDETEVFEDWLEDEYGLFKVADNLRATGINAPREKRPNLYYPIYLDVPNMVYYVTDDDKPVNEKHETILPLNPDGEELSWYWSKTKFNSSKDNLILKKTKNGWQFYRKQRPKLGDLPTKKPKSVLYSSKYSSSTATTQLKKIMGRKVFNNPKPIPFLKDLLTIGASKDSIILDSFAGSGTTMHAVMELNKEDGGNRKCIMVQMTEATDKEPDKNICKDITRERVKRAIEKYDFDSGFKYKRIGRPISPETMLEGDLPTYEELAKYVYYLCTGSDLDDSQNINAESFFVGTDKSTAVFLIYKPDFDKLMELALTREFAENIVRKTEGKRRIVYAPVCFLSKQDLKGYDIEFVNLPYDLHTTINKNLCN